MCGEEEEEGERERERERAFLPKERTGVLQFNSKINSSNQKQHAIDIITDLGTQLSSLSL